MDKKSKTTRLSELMTIRDILMGEIIEEYNGRFEDLEEKLNAQKSLLEKKEAALNTKIDDLRQTIETSHSKLSDTVSKNSIQDKALIGELLVKIGQELNSIKQ